MVEDMVFAQIWRVDRFNARFMVREMKASRARSALPLSVQRALRKLGQDISPARRRRDLTIATVAERAFVGRNTITRVERGNPGVSLGIYATVLFVLGLSDRLKDLVDPATDQLGLSLDIARLPKRVRAARTVSA
jgi:DNA-binding XRE family transcriptional regulator